MKNDYGNIQTAWGHLIMAMLVSTLGGLAAGAVVRDINTAFLGFIAFMACFILAAADEVYHYIEYLDGREEDEARLNGGLR